MSEDRYLQDECGGEFRKLAKLWGPVNYQYISLGDDYETKRDLLCTVNFGCYPNAGQPSKSDCWDTKIVRERLKAAELSSLYGAAYYSVAVTDTHYFILYSYYHADDTTHPNDLEGCLVILERVKGGKRPALLGMVTVAHNDFVPFVVNDRMIVRPAARPNWQKDVLLQVEEEPDGDHPLIQQEQGKHGMYGLGKNLPRWLRLRRRLLEIAGKRPDVIIYYPGTAATVYTKKGLHRGRGSPYEPTFYYELVDILNQDQGLWDRFKDASKHNGNRTFTKEGAFHSTIGGVLGAANGPWLWKSGLLKSVGKGAMWNSPAELASEMFELPNGKTFSKKYHKTMAPAEPVK